MPVMLRKIKISNKSSSSTGRPT